MVSLWFCLRVLWLSRFRKMASCLGVRIKRMYHVDVKKGSFSVLAHEKKEVA